MIILSICAKNFMKYEDLKLRDLPRSGIIGIVGDNEAGKTTILEAITFAIYGRTIKVAEDAVARLVHWKAGELEVKVTIQFNSGEFRIERRYDREGGRECVLYRIENGREELVEQGLSKVNDAIAREFPIDFEVYRQSFYLGQKELSNLYEKRLPNSLEIMDAMTGLDRLKSSHQEVKERIAPIREEIIDLEKKISVAQVKIESYDEQLLARVDIESDLARQRERLEQINEQLRGEQDKVSIQERFRQDLSQLISLYESLRDGFVGYELKRRLVTRSQEFVALFQGLKATIEARQNDHKELSEYLGQRESQFSTSSEIYQELKGLNYLVQERLGYLDRNARGQFGSVNIKSYFIAQTLRDRETLIRHQIQEIKDSHLMESNALYFGFLVIGALVISLGIGFSHQYHLKIMQMEQLFQVGAILFVSSIMILLVWFTYLKSKARHELKDMLSKLQMNLNVVQREMMDEQEELEKLRQFELSQVTSYEHLKDLKSKFSYEPLRKNLNQLITDFESRKEEFAIGIKQFQDFEATLKEDREKLNALQIELDHLNNLEQQYAGMEKELTAYSFVTLEEISPNELSKASDYDGEFFRLGSLVGRLKELLRGDTSHSDEIFDRRLKDYESKLGAILEEYKDSSLLPDIWDDKRLRFEWTGEQMLDLDLETLLEKLSELKEQHDYLHNLRTSWFEKFQKNKESLLNEEFDEKNSTQRIQFMEEALGRMKEVEGNRENWEKQLEEGEQQLTDSRRKFKRTELLEDLLRGTIESVQSRLSPNLARFIGSILPEITDQRYRRVRVSPDLEIEVYSPDKEGYVDFTSLSGGTADQLLVCLRMAFASSLVQSTFDEGYSQFLCLDEPIYAFDSKRANHFLDMVVRFNPNFQQIFLITHNNNLFSHFDHTIQTGLDSPTLGS